MSPECRRCLAVVGAAAIIVTHCPIHAHDECPYIHEQPHTHQEAYFPSQYRNTPTVAASSGDVLDHPSVLGSVDDPNRDGFRIYFFNVTPDED